MNRLKATATATAVGVFLVVTGCSPDSSEESVASTTTTTASTEAAQSTPAVAASTAESVCAQIEEAGIGANCVRGEGNGLALAATEVYDFDLPSVPGEGGAVMAFDDVDLYQKTVQSYEDAAFLAGPHRYGSEQALIFVQINEGLSPSDGQKVKGIVDAL